MLHNQNFISSDDLCLGEMIYCQEEILYNLEQAKKCLDESKWHLQKVDYYVSLYEECKKKFEGEINYGN